MTRTTSDRSLFVAMGAWLVGASAWLMPTHEVRAEWGDLKAKFTVERADFPDREIRGRNDKGELANVMVWLLADERDKPPIHEQAQAAVGKPHEIQIANNTLSPRVSIATAGQGLTLFNLDAVGHVPNFHFEANSKFQPLLDAGASFSTDIGRAESRPCRVDDVIRAETEGYLMVAPTPYHALSKQDGSLTIKNLPVGKWRFVFWHESLSGLARVKRGDAEIIWLKGTASLEITPEGLDLGEVRVLRK